MWKDVTSPPTRRIATAIASSRCRQHSQGGWDIQQSICGLAREAECAVTLGEDPEDPEDPDPGSFGFF